MIEWKFNELRYSISPNPSMTKIADGTNVSRTTLHRISKGDKVRIDADSLDAILTWFSDELGRKLTIGDLLEWKRGKKETNE